jgi:hypothetical protein
MGIFDIFTGDPQKKAAEDTRNYITGQQTALTANNNTARDAAGNLIQTGYGDAAGALGQGYNTAAGAINGGANNAYGYLDQGTQGALGQLGQARTDLTANGGAYQPLSDLATQYGKGAGLYADALGINGAAGTANARSAFQQAPGYETTLNAGIDAVNRRANAAGMLVGGNANRDAADYAGNLANQGYNSWLTNLAGFNPLQLSATQGAATGNQANNQALAGIDTAGANLLNTAGQNKAGIATGQGSSLADLAKGYYGQLGANDVAQGTALAANTTGANNANQAAVLNLTPGYTKTYSDAANAQTAGSGNLWNLGLNVAKLAAGGAGGASGGASGGGGSSFLPSASFLQNGMSWGG